jgi:solute carrier family 25 folate transporter 32
MYIYLTIADGLASIYRTEGVRGLYLGTTLALFGVLNGAIQFMAYEEMKKWAFERRRRRGKPVDKLVRSWLALDTGT